ncbi:MAG: hypothetical protein R3323_04970 [Wenzhouxiangellaceae bacterium]|nr:hypothetical protein [Wenzhouxiangellaceae bacterium]
MREFRSSFYRVPSNPLARFGLALLGLAVLAVSFVLGVFFLAVVFGLAILGGVVLAIRNWWTGRRPDEDSTVEAEYRVIRRERDD